MKKSLIIVALIFSAGFLNASPGRGGYMGHRVIVGGEFSYSPFYDSVNAFFTKYNFQYGGSLGFIVARRSQLNLIYNMWSLGGNQEFNSSLYENDRVKGMEFGVNLRTFRKERGGIAPIGKFYDLGLNYSQSKFVVGAGHDGIQIGEPGYDFSKLELTSLVAHVAFGTQMVFKNRIVGNTGLRFGLPLNIAGNDLGNFMPRRLNSKEYFSVFFGVGILL
ncbi:hypothetical protein BH09BAC5_BH09BAC5_07360 [soil metagenome]